MLYSNIIDDRGGLTRFTTDQAKTWTFCAKSYIMTGFYVATYICIKTFLGNCFFFLCTTLSYVLRFQTTDSKGLNDRRQVGKGIFCYLGTKN